MTMKLPAAVPSHAHPRWGAASACPPVGGHQCMGNAPLPPTGKKAESCVSETTPSCHHHQQPHLLHAPSRPSATARGSPAPALCHAAAAAAVGCKQEELPDDQDLNHRLLHHPRPLCERLGVSIELAQPCRERITENGVVKEVHVIVKNVPFSIHVRLPRAGNESASDDPAGAGVVDLRDADIEASLRYDGDGGRAVPFVQRAPLEIVASRVADDGQSAVLTARVRALSSQHQNRLFVVHVRIHVPAPGASSSGALPEQQQQLMAPPHPHLAGLPVREALTEPVQVISKPRSSRKRVVRRKRTLGDMLLECTQRIERTQMSHLGAIGTLTKRCRLIPRGGGAGDAGGHQTSSARPVPSRISYPAPSSSPPPLPSTSSSLAFPDGPETRASTSSSSFEAAVKQQQQQQEADDPSAWLFLAEGGTPFPEDPQLMMLMDLPAVALPTFSSSSSSMYSASSLDNGLLLLGADVPNTIAADATTTTTTASTPGMYVAPLASTAHISSSGSPSGVEVERLLADPRHHPQQPPGGEEEEDPMGRALLAFLTAYSALPTTDRSMAVRRVLRRFEADRLPALSSLLAVVASRPRPIKRPAEGSSASFQSCVCTSCSFEAELRNIDGFYKDLINLEFSFQ